MADRGKHTKEVYHHPPWQQGRDSRLGLKESAGRPKKAGRCPNDEDH